MEHFYIIANGQKEESAAVAEQIQDYLERHGRTCGCCQAESIGCGQKFTEADTIPADTQCVIVLGGDGTLIQAARDLKGRDLPLLGVNLGTLGYLAEIEKQNMFPALDKILDGAYQIEERMMLWGAVYKGDKAIMEDVALNDIAINRDGPLRIINFNIYVNGQLLNEYSADGMIISTPTGSTGYNLSAGGPIISPTAEMIVMTPICSHALNNRSIVLSDEDEVIIEVGESRRWDVEKAEVAFDGNRLLKLETGDRIVVRKAVKKAKIVKISSQSFLEVLRKKISEN